MKRCPLKLTCTCHTNCAWYDEHSKECAILLLAQRCDAVTSTEDKLLIDTPERYYYTTETNA